MKPTVQQQAVIDFVREQTGLSAGSKKQSIFISAVAGAGKTSLLMMIAELIKFLLYNKKQSTVMCAFNVHIAKEITARLERMGITWREVESKTINGLGNRFLTLAFQKGVQKKNNIPDDNTKYKDLTEEYMNKNMYVLQRAGVDVEDKSLMNEIRSEIKSLTSFARNTQTDASNEEKLVDLIWHYDLNVDVLAKSWPFVWKSVDRIIELGKKQYAKAGIIDYDDQIIYPVEMNLARKFYDIVAVDEAQDLNRVKMELLKKVVKDDGMFIFVGDERQAVQGFSGSDTNSVKNIIEEFNCKVFPLSVCFRCDAEIIKIAQQIVPHIEARPDAPDGIVKELKSEAQMFDMLEEGYNNKLTGEKKDASLVLCRVNADLVKGALECIRRGKRAVVRGQNIGQGILSLLKRVAEFAKVPIEALDFRQVGRLLQMYASAEIDRLSNMKDSDEKTDKFLDRVDTLRAVMEAYLGQVEYGERPSCSGLQAYLETFIDDSDNGKDCEICPIEFSSIHKAKGSEKDEVYLIKPELMPFPAAKRDWQVEQEWNLIYVAVTRAKHALYFVGGVPGGLILPDVEQPELEIEEVMVVAPKSKAGRKTKESKGEERDTYLQFSLSPEEKETISLMREVYSQEIGKEVSLSHILKQVIKASPVYQQAEVQYSEGARPTKANKNAGKTPNAVRA